ncbi:zinc finger protein 436-like [Wyeomyia smithii]|uniref:zinc finger protein 436-like n=1 Tax=Wyeomyia smithii TaxID=174621 RepID=UPI002467FE35|nr:zinc finger protein 436-like [Wyeomyia smithii]XP_055550629.1 zinc finger protein 436-like [Wyeomyia smithii]
MAIPNGIKLDQSLIKSEVAELEELNDEKKAVANLQAQPVRFECNICGKQVRKLQRHKRIHWDHRRYKCDMCGKEVKNLYRHKLNHLEIERPFQCDFCGKKFTKKSHVDRHREIHTGNRPCKCGMCGAAFITNSDLAQHERIHTRERAHPCDICGRDFIRISDLRHHRRIHTGERPYSCPVCGEDFYRNSHLKRHQKKHELLVAPVKRGRKKKDMSEYMSKNPEQLFILKNQTNSDTFGLVQEGM